MKSLNLALIMAFTVLLYALTANASGHISLNYAYNPIDSLVGLSGDYEKDFGGYEVETDGQLQSGDIIEGDLHAAVAFDMGPVQAKPFVEANIVRTEDWGRTLDMGAKLNFPIGDLDIAAGLFGRNSDAFKPIETGTRVQGVAGSEKWKESSILNFNDLGLLNALIETQYQWKRVQFGVTGIVDISNREFHQIILDASTGWKLTSKLSLNVDAQHITQIGDGQQFSFNGGVSYNF